MRHPPLLVPPEAAGVLRARIAATHAPPLLRLRARIVLLSADGLGPAAIARELGCSTQTVVTWRERFRARGLDGLGDAPRSGRPVTVDAEAVIRATVLPGAAGRPAWSSRSLARHLGVSNVTVANVWRQWGVRPGPSGRVGLRLDPELDRLPVAVLGVHVDPAVRVAAVVLDGAGHPPPAAGPGGPELDRFLDEVGAVAARIGAGAAPVRLIVEGTDEPVRRWARDHPATAVHLVPPPLSWERVVLVARLGAGVLFSRPPI